MLRPLIWMAVAVAGVAALALVDQEREAARALADFGEEQHALAQTLLSAALMASSQDPAGLAANLSRLAPTGHRALVIQPPGTSALPGALIDSHGRPVNSAPLAEGLAQSKAVVTLSREQSKALGLPERTSVAGLARATLPQGRVLSVALVSSAERDRDRARRARWRVLGAIAVAAALVGTFGGAALRRQRQELTLARELAVMAQLSRLDRSAVMLTLASGLAHEMGTPLAVIQGRAEQLLGGEKAGPIVAQVQRIQDVVRGFLHLARGGALSLEILPPREVVESACRLVEHRFRSSAVRLELPPPGELPSLRGNRLLLEHALINLLLNARDACTGGGVVQVAVILAPERLSFVVTDDGHGIPPQVASRVTEAFFSTKPEGEGTGLGLAIVSEIAKIHHGALTLTPHPPRGTRAAIELPRDPEEPAHGV